MVALATILKLVNGAKSRALTLAQASLPEHQYKAFKTMFLDIFGQKGLEAELARVYAEDQHQDRNGRE